MIIFKTLLILCGLIGVGTGANDWLRGASVKGDFGELAEHENAPMLNFTLRFLGGIWMGFGALLVLFATDIERYRPALILALSMVILAGIGRVISINRHGIDPKTRTTVYSILAVELMLVPILLAWLFIAGF